MEKFVIEGGRPLYGEIEIQSAKNAVLPLLAASVLTEERIVIHNCPRITDVLNMAQILEELGCRTSFTDGALTVDPSDAANHEIPAALAKELRSSVFMLGSVLSATVLTILPEALRAFSDYRMIAYAVVLVLVMIFRPQGLLGSYDFSLSRVIERVMNRDFPWGKGRGGDAEKDAEAEGVSADAGR